MQVRCLGWEDPLEEGMATPSSILVWKISWTEEPFGLGSIGSQRVGHNCGQHTCTLMQESLICLKPAPAMLRLLYCHWFGLGNCLHTIYCYLFIYYFPVIFAVKGKLNYLDQLSLAFFFFPKEYCACAQSCPTLCNCMDCSPPGSTVHGIFQARILECVAIFSSWGLSRPRDGIHVSCVSCIGRWILYAEPHGKPFAWLKPTK